MLLLRYRLAAILLAMATISCGGTKTPNILFIVVDTLRADHMGLYGYTRATSPRLDAWLAQGTVFEHAIAPSPWTLPSVATLLTGTPPSRHGAGGKIDSGQAKSGFSPLDPSLETLGQRLGQSGYATAAIVNNPFLHPELGLDRGFDDYDYAGGDNSVIRPAQNVVDRGLAWLDANGGKPFFLLMHFFDPHMDYDPPQKLRGTFTHEGRYPVTEMEQLRLRVSELTAEEREFIEGAYDEEILHVDTQMGRLHDQLSQRNLLQNTVVVFVSDHGEELFEHGGFEHGHSLFQELLHVPLTFVGPQIPAGRIAETAGLVDVMPTVLEIMGLETSTPGGRSLWGRMTRQEKLAPDHPYVAESLLHGTEQKALVQWPWKLIFDLQANQRRLYDLARDPGEQNDRAPHMSKLRDAMTQRLTRSIQTSTMQRLSQHAADLPPEVRQQLKALGYID